MRALWERQRSALWVQGCDRHFRYFADRIHSKKNLEGFFFAFYAFAVSAGLDEVEEKTLAFVHQLHSIRATKSLDHRLIVRTEEVVFYQFESGQFLVP